MHSSRRHIAVLVGSASLALAAHAADGPIRPHLRDVTVESGLGQYEYTPNGPYTHPGPVAFVDFDNDDLPDLYLAAPDGYRNRLFRNLGGGRFVDASAGSGADLPLFTVSVAAADYDNDGWTDLYLGNTQGNRLLRNDGDGTFTDVTAEAGVSGAPIAESYSVGWLDCDGDGWLDLYVGNWTGVRQDRLYRSQRDGTFVDITQEAGLVELESVLALGIADFDADGLPDVYASHDGADDTFYHNVGDCRFSDVTARTGTGYHAGQAMGVAIGDYDNDGWLDIYITDTDVNDFDHFARNPLYHNNGDGTFTNVAVETNTRGSFSWGAAFADLEGDGWLDLYVATHSNPTPRPDLIYWNNRGNFFLNLAQAEGMTNPRSSRGVAVADLERDGDPDLFVVSSPRPAAPGSADLVADRSVLWRNDSEGNSWIGFDLVGSVTNRSAIGARVVVEDGRGLRQMREIPGAMSYSAAHDLALQFGIGPTAGADATVYWPTGQQQPIGPVAAGQYVLITEGAPMVLVEGDRPDEVTALPATTEVRVRALGPRFGEFVLVGTLEREGVDVGAPVVRTLNVTSPGDRRLDLRLPTLETAEPGSYRWRADLLGEGVLLGRSEWRFVLTGE